MISFYKTDKKVSFHKWRLSKWRVGGWVPGPDPRGWGRRTPGPPAGPVLLGPDAATPQQMAGHVWRFFTKIKELIIWSWSYLWALWFLLVITVIYYLRGPLKITDNIGMGEYIQLTHLVFSVTICGQVKLLGH